MNCFSLALVLGAWLIAQTGDSIQVEPGKQLPQSVTVRAESDCKSRDVTIHYLLFAPKDYEPNGKKWPLMLFLHGYGECGNGTSELDRVKIHGPPGFVDSRPDFPFVVVTPQCPPPKYDLKEIARAWKSESSSSSSITWPRIRTSIPRASMRPD